LILGVSRTNHKRSLLLRRSFPDLERSLISRSLEFFGDRKAYNSTKHVWLIDGRRIEFGHMERIGTAQIPGDEANYASAPYDFIGFDQLEQFTEYGYLFMFSRARSVIKKQRVRMVSSANPVGEYLDWIIKRWGAWLDETHPNPAKPGEFRYYKRNDDGIEVETTADDPDGLSRTFIPAGLADNPYLGDDYRRNLNMLPEPLRSALLKGDFMASILDDAYQVIPRSWVRAAQARWKNKAPDGRLTVGVDVARGGDDQTVLVKKRADWFGKPEKYPGRNTPTGKEVRTLIAGAMQGNKDAQAAIDVIGIGASAFDLCIEAGMSVFAVNFAEGSDMKDASGLLHFINKRAEYYWLMREALDPNNARQVMLPDDPELLGDLCAPRWAMTTRGIKIEDKEAIKERLGRSPDVGDAIVIANGAANGQWLIY